MQILQFTDPHLFGSAAGSLRGVVTDTTLRAVVDAAFAEVPGHSAVLMTGDLVQDDPTGYARFREILGVSRKPVLCIPGNHDEPAAMRLALAAPPFEYCGAHAFGAWQFIMLDSVDPGHVGGRLTPAELERLDRTLAGSRAHAMVCLHHHPVDMGSRWIDGIGLANPEDFWRVIDAHAHVRAVTWGHVHQEFEGRRGDVRLFATPSTGAQFLPLSDRYAIDERPPAYRRFDLAADGRMRSAVNWLATLPVQHTGSR